MRLQHTEALERDYEITIRDRGVVTNRLDVRKKQAQDMIEWVHTVLHNVPVWKVRERAAIRYALEGGVSLLRYESDGDMAQVFREIAVDLDTQFGGETDD